MSSSNFVATLPSNTEVPAFNVSFFLRDESETTVSLINAEKLGVTQEEFNSVMADGFEFNAYYQNLKLGDGTTNSIQLPHKFRADGLPSQRRLSYVASEGSAVQKYSLVEFSQNSDANDGPEKPQHIGLNVKHAPQTGVYVFQNANVCYENTNGFNVTVRSSLRNILSNYTPDGTVYAYVIVTPVENIDVLGKTGSNMSDFSIASSIASGVLDADASGNNLIISKQRVAVTGSDNEFKVSLDGSNIIRDVFMNILVDIYRSQRTTLVAPMIILNKLPNVEKVKHDLLSDPTNVFNIDQNQVDIAKHYMIVNRIVLNDSSKNLLESFESIETDVKSYTILRENPGRRLTMSELNGANAYDTNVLSFKTPIAKTSCGHDNVEVETMIFFTSLLSRSLINKTDLLDNIYWYLKDGQAGQFAIVPETLLDVSGQQPELEMVSYRKAVVSQLLASVPSKQSLFVRNYEDAKVPSVWYSSSEVYDAFGTIQLIKDYEYRLKGISKQFPIYYEKSMLEGVVENYSFPSLNYYGELKMDSISASFVDDYFGQGWLDNFLSAVGTTDPTVWLSQAQEFVAHAKSKNVILTQSLNNLSVELAGLTTVSEFNKYSLLLVTCLHHLVNSAEDADFTFQPSKLVGSNVNVMKNRYEQIPLTIELSVERLPRNLLLETTSLRLSEVTFVNNTSLRLSILDSVGNPVNMILPVLLELKTKDVEVTQRREFEILTDYLVDVLDRIDRTYLMNCIWYTVDSEGKREVVRAEPFGQMYDSQYGVIQSETLPVRADAFALPKILYNKMMGDAPDNATGQQLRSSPNAMMKLNDTKDDLTARGELKDFRYHGINENIYAEDPPSQTGGFALQVLRWIKSGLINKPEDNTIIGNEDFIIQHIRTKAFDTVDSSMIELADSVDSNGETQNAVKTFLKQKLVDSLNDGSQYDPLQNLLEHIYSIDKQRFTINEVARSRVVDTDLIHTNGLPLHMLPIISDDTISILTTVNGKLVDPNEGSLGSPSNPSTLAGAMELINQRLRNPGHLNPTPDTDRIGSVTMSVTGNAIDAENNIGARGIYSNCVNLLVAPEVGPFEKSVAEGVEHTYPVTYNGKTIYTDSAEVPEYNPLTYQAFRERSWTVRFNLESNVDAQTYEQIRVAQFNAESGSNADSGGVVAQPGTTNLGDFGVSANGLTYPLSLVDYTGDTLAGDEQAQYTFIPHGVGVTNLINQINSSINETTNTITTTLQSYYDNEATTKYIVLTNNMDIYGNGELFAMLGAFGSQPDNLYSINIQTSETEKVTFKVIVNEMAYVQGIGMVMIISGFDSNNLADLMTYLDLAYQNGMIDIYNSETGEYGTYSAAVRLEAGKKLFDKTLLGTTEYPDTRFGFELFVHGSGADFETHGVTTEILKSGLQGTYVIDTTQIETSQTEWLVNKPTNIVPRYSSSGMVGFAWYNNADPTQATLRLDFTLSDNENSVSNVGNVQLYQVNNVDGDINLANSFIAGLSLMVVKSSSIPAPAPAPAPGSTDGANTWRLTVSDGEPSIQFSEFNLYNGGVKVDLVGKVSDITLENATPFGGDSELNAFDGDTNTKFGANITNPSEPVSFIVTFTEAITADAFSYNTGDDHNIPWQLEAQHQYRAPRTFTLSNNGIVVLSVENYDTSVLDNNQETAIFSFQ